MTLLKSGTELEHLTAVTLQRFKVKMLDIKDTESKVKVSLKLQCIAVVILSSYRFSSQLENVAIVMHCIKFSNLRNLQQNYLSTYGIH